MLTMFLPPVVFKDSLGLEITMIIFLYAFGLIYVIIFSSWMIGCLKGKVIRMKLLVKEIAKSDIRCLCFC